MKDGYFNYNFLKNNFESLLKREEISSLGIIYKGISEGNSSKISISSSIIILLFNNIIIIIYIFNLFFSFVLFIIKIAYQLSH